jgi:hypothetical protein
MEGESRESWKIMIFAVTLLFIDRSDQPLRGLEVLATSPEQHNLRYQLREHINIPQALVRYHSHNFIFDSDHLFWLHGDASRLFALGLI